MLHTKSSASVCGSPNRGICFNFSSKPHRLHCSLAPNASSHASGPQFFPKMASVLLCIFTYKKQCKRLRKPRSRNMFQFLLYTPSPLLLLSTQRFFPREYTAPC